MSINLPDIEATSEKLRRILGCYKIRFTFQTDSTLRNILCKPNDRVAAEDKNNMVYEIGCSYSKSMYFGESKRYLKSRPDEQNRSVKNCDCKKSEIAKRYWEADHNSSYNQKKVVDRDSRLIPRRIKNQRNYSQACLQRKPAVPEKRVRYIQVSAIQRFLDNLTGSKFREICVFCTILRPSSQKNYCEALNSKNS